ncbi:MAG: branched-chain amino acid ABC transporter permease [candidate division Zixibacteria bacterium]|nr:branched-chain amino acid ABC transporter permease [candidate division Zixibacteria bacterium]
MSQFVQQLVNGLSLGAIYALIALGYTMVYGILRLINFAHGDVYMVGAFVGYYLGRLVSAGAASSSPSVVNFFLVLGGSMAACALLGWVLERSAYRPLRKAPRLNALITAIGISLLLENLGQLVFGADPKDFPTLVERTSLSVGIVTFSNIQLIVIVTAIVLMLGLQYIVHRTKMGTAMRAVSFSHDASGLMGINIHRVISFTFVLGSALAAAAGILVGLYNPKIDPLMGIMPGLKAFVAAVLGGIGNIPGAIVGGLIMGVAETLTVGYLSSTYRDAITFVILVAVLLFRPTGLFGTTARAKV